MRRQERRHAALWLCAAILAALPAGCGGARKMIGGGGRPGVSQTSVATGEASVSVQWPGSPPTREASRARLIPYMTNSVVVVVRDANANEVARATLVKAAGQASSHTFQDLKVGPHTIGGEARANEDGTGDVLAKGTLSFEVKVNARASVALTVASVIDHVEITSGNVVFGGVSTLSATAKAADGSVVLLPAATATWSVDDPDHLYLATAEVAAARGRAEAPVSKTVVAKGAGTATVTVQIAEGVENGQVKARTAQQTIRVLGSYSPGSGGVREHGYADTCFQLGQGYESNTAEKMDCPFQTVPNAERVTSGSPKGEFDMGWDESTRRVESGASFDAELSAKYLTNKAKASASWSKALNESTYGLTFQVQKRLDFGHYWIKPSSLRLSDTAAALLATSPAAFRQRYGDRITIGERRWSYVTCRLNRTFQSRAEAESKGFHFDASGKIGAVGFEAATNFKERMKSLSESSTTSIFIRTNAPSGDVESTIIKGAEQVDTIINSFSALIPGLDEYEDPSTQQNPKVKLVAYGFVTAPIEWALPGAAEGEPPPSPAEWRLSKLLQRYYQLEAMYTRLRAIYDQRDGFYKFLGTARIDQIREDRDRVETQMRAIADRMPELLAGNDTGGLSPDLDELPSVRWPDPRIQRIFGQFYDGIWVPAGSVHLYDVNYDIRVYDCANLLDEGKRYHFLYGPSVSNKIWTPSTPHPNCETRELPDGGFEFHVNNLGYNPFPVPDGTWGSYLWLPSPGEPFRVGVGYDANNPIVTLTLPMEQLSPTLAWTMAWNPRPW